MQLKFDDQTLEIEFQPSICLNNKLRREKLHYLKENHVFTYYAEFDFHLASK